MNKIDNFILVGLGGAGIAMCKKLQETMDLKQIIYSIDCIDNINFLYCFSRINCDTSQSNVEILPNMDSSAKHLLNFTPSQSKFLFIVGLGGFAGTSLFEFLLNKEEFKSSRFVCILPFTFEGEIRTKNSIKALELSKTIGSQVYVYPNQNLIDGNHPKEKFTEAFKRQAKMIITDLQSELTW